MVAVTLSGLFIPLRASLMRLRDKTLTGATAREAVNSIVLADHLLTQQLEILPDRVIERVVTTTPVDKKRIAAAEIELSRRTGKPSSMQVRRVANEEELIGLREHLYAPEALLPPPTIKNLFSSIRPLVDEPWQAVWPTDAAQLIGREFSFAKDAAVLRLTYLSPRAFDSATQEAILKTPRRQLPLENLTTVFEGQGNVKRASSAEKR